MLVSVFIFKKARHLSLFYFFVLKTIGTKSLAVALEESNARDWPAEVLAEVEVVPKFNVYTFSLFLLFFFS